MINLKDLLMHEIQDLYSAEEQIIEALPSMIEKANNSQLKKALQDHLKVTEKQKDRLDQVKQLLGEEEEGEGEEKKGVFSRLFGGGAHKCKGTEGIIKEGQNILGENMTTEVRDAAIIASTQKIEHYEICGYGTARAYARELNLGEVAELLEETLNEEYAADDLLTDLAVGRLNEEAEKGKGNGRGTNKSSNRGGAMGGNGKSKSNGSARSASNGKSGSSSRSASKSSASKTASAKTSSSKSGASKASKSTAGSRGGSQSKSKSASSSRSKSSAGRSRSSRAKSR